MKDPPRFLDQKENELEGLLLRSALDESPPSGLTRRTLAAISAAGIAVAAGDAAAKVSGGAAAAAGLKATGVIAGAGIWSAIGIGALAGLVTLGILDRTTGFGPRGSTKIAEEARAIPPVLAEPPAKGPLGEERPAAPGAEAAALSPPPDPRPAPSASGPRPSSRSASMLASEITLLDAARRSLLGGDPAASLALLDRHAREFGDGQLAHEAAVLRVEALAKRGDREGAAAAARRFLRAHPNSPHADRIEAAAGIDAPE
jgi:hypothetical protein